MGCEKGLCPFLVINFGDERILAGLYTEDVYDVEYESIILP